ncbi:hypothetical protein NDU88_003287 [Pleurodeles waltl]|uniref:Uncharacterized protein n=1 Tax=Pleurodeles waltl TaxID=8319 RepID=A0AAV7KV64_PLEWA|nr:hypothetical protein NDU88_003287 [Pleurodeles waltl]
MPSRALQGLQLKAGGPCSTGGCSSAVFILAAPGTAGAVQQTPCCGDAVTVRLCSGPALETTADYKLTTWEKKNNGVKERKTAREERGRRVLREEEAIARGVESVFGEDDKPRTARSGERLRRRRQAQDPAESIFGEDNKPRTQRGVESDLREGKGKRETVEEASHAPAGAWLTKVRKRAGEEERIQVEEGGQHWRGISACWTLT